MSKKLFILLLAAVLSFPNMVLAQTQEAPKRTKHRIYAEVGSYLFVSSVTINYEPTIFESKSRAFRLNGRIGMGLGLVLGFDGSHGISGILGGVTMDFGRKNSHFLLSSGLAVGSSFNEIEKISAGFDRLETSPLLEVGWRYEKPKGGMIYKVAGGTMGLSLGVGYSF